MPALRASAAHAARGRLPGVCRTLGLVGTLCVLLVGCNTIRDADAPMPGGPAGGHAAAAQDDQPLGQDILIEPGPPPPDLAMPSELALLESIRLAASTLGRAAHWSISASEEPRQLTIEVSLPKDPSVEADPLAVLNACTSSDASVIRPAGSMEVSVISKRPPKPVGTPVISPAL